MGKPDARYGAPPDRPIHNRQETTLGIETSKYQEEKKENSIPSVAASESGRAQTKKLGFGVTKNHDEEEEVFGMAHLRG